MTNELGGTAAVRRAMIEEHEVRELAQYRGDPAVSTVYLDVDGRRHPSPEDYRTSFDALADRLRRSALDGGDERIEAAVEADVARMREWLESAFQRDGTRGVAMFACAADGWFRTVELPYAVRDGISLGANPRVDQLIALLESRLELIVALIDRRRLRLLLHDLGRITELAGLDEPAPRGVDTSTEYGVFARHTQELVRTHVRHAAAAIDRALARHPAAGVVLGGPDEAVAGLTAELHGPALDRLLGRVSLAVTAPMDEIVDAVGDFTDELERRHDAEVAAELVERASSDDRSVVGLGPTLESLTDKRVDRMIVTAGLAAPGAVCPACGHLDASTGSCGRCGAQEIDVDDVVAIAVERALAQHSTVEYVRAGVLDLVGGIGAFERF